MTKFSPAILLAISLLALSTVDASAQTGSGKESANSSVSHPSGASKSASRRVPADANPRVPGATGDAIVRGDDSTIAGDRGATRDEQSGEFGDN